MKRQNVLKSIFLSLIVSSISSSCGLIEKFKTPEQPTSSDTTVSTTVEKQDASDDLFAKTMNDTKEQPLEAKTDAPNNITTEDPAVKDDLKSLEKEFSGNDTKEVKVEESLPEIKSELPKALSENANSDAGKVMSYKVQKGETLMQIAFKLYGDVSKWKEIKHMNSEKLSKNSALSSNMELKYKAPEQVFVWNPEGTPYMIKSGQTLGTISNSVYQTPKKWKSIWENNKPLIKNPNVIYAGFTLYYKGSGVANYVQPKVIEESKAISKTIEKSININEEEKVDQTKEVQSATIRNSNTAASKDIIEEVKVDEIQDEALVN